MPMNSEKGVAYFQALRKIGEINPLTAVTAQSLHGSDIVDLQLNYPDTLLGRNMVAVAQLLCTVCQINKICSTLNREEQTRDDSIPKCRRLVASIKMGSDYRFSNEDVVIEYKEETKRFEANRAIRGRKVRDGFIGTSMCTSSKPVWNH